MDRINKKKEMETLKVSQSPSKNTASGAIH